MGTTIDKLNKLLDTKEKIKEALKEKVDTEVSDKFSSYPEIIGTLPSKVKMKFGDDITDISGIFRAGYGAYWKSIDLRGWDLSGITNVKEFMRLDNLTYANLSGLRLNVTDVTQLCYGDKALEEIDVTNLVSNTLTSITVPFYNCTSLKKIIGLETWDTSNVTSMPSVFYGCSSLEELDLSAWDVSKCTTFSAILYGCTGLKKLNLSGWPATAVYSSIAGSPGLSQETELEELILRDVKDVQTGAQIIPNCNIKVLDVTGMTISESNGISSSGLFSGRSGLHKIVGLDTITKIPGEYLYHLFCSCSNLESIEGIENWDISTATFIISPFGSCPEVKEINIANWDVSNVANCGGVAINMENLEKLDVSNWQVNCITYSADNTNYWFVKSTPKLSTILFGEGWGKCDDEHGSGLDLSECNSSGNDTYAAYQLADETFSSMLKMYDRKANGLTSTFTILLNSKTTIPDGWTAKMEAKGYTITIV